jgi:hypothetical protein
MLHVRHFVWLERTGREGSGYVFWALGLGQRPLLTHLTYHITNRPDLLRWGPNMLDAQSRMASSKAPKIHVVMLSPASAVRRRAGQESQHFMASHDVWMHKTFEPVQTDLARYCPAVYG